jgi:hypothetical protein|tara:strand:+ start:798 stop:986 length:189 start_codon:yes stop_codon:yes gene_type:complete
MNMAASIKELASMASPNKQQKRAQRAKAKAKQNRSGKTKPMSSIRCWPIHWSTSRSTMSKST